MAAGDVSPGFLPVTAITDSDYRPASALEKQRRSLNPDAPRNGSWLCG